MSIPRNIRNYLESNHVSFWRKLHPAAMTGQELAQAEHVPAREVAKTIVLEADGRLILAVLPVDYSVSFDKLQEGIPARDLRLVPEDEFASAFPGCEKGAMPPFGALFKMPVYCDERLARQEEIEFNGGTHREVVRMAFSEFDVLERPVVLNFAEKAPTIRIIRAA